jgi:hypothetical protein
MIQQLAFLITLGIAVYLIRKRVIFISKNIKLGKKAEINDHKGERLKNVLLVALVRKKCSKRSFLPSFTFSFMWVFGD